MIPPLSQQIADNGFIYIYDDVLHLLELKKEDFERQILRVPSKEKYFTNQIESTYPSGVARQLSRMCLYDDDIDVFEFFHMGWAHGENGLGDRVSENIYKWGHVALGQINAKYQGEILPTDYYHRLNEVAKSEFLYGVVCVYYYYWLKKEYEELLNHDTLKAQKNESGANDAKGAISYQWQGKPVELESFYKEVKGVYISNETSLLDFCAVFDGSPISKISKLKWKEDNATEVLLFVHEMIEAGLLKRGKSMNYLQLSACFCKPDGSPFTENFKNLYQPIKNGLTTPNDKIIALINPFR